MLRSLFTGITGLRAHQTMLDVTGNNIANVNTTGFKSSRALFEDTLSQQLQGAGAAGPNTGATNPSQVGLGVQVSAITQDLTQGSTQSTARALDMMINGEGYFVVNVGGENMYTRNGAFNIDPQGRLVTQGGGLVQGWSGVGGVIQSNRPIGAITLPLATTMPSRATDRVVMEGNLPFEAEVGKEFMRSIKVYDAAGVESMVEVTFARTATGWGITATRGNDSATGALAVDADGTVTGGNLTVGGAEIDLAAITGFANLTTVEASSQNGRSAGTLRSIGVNDDGTITGVFSNDQRLDIGQIAVAYFTNAGGLEKAGSSYARESTASGVPQIGTAGSGSRGGITSRALEMSNVDLAQEFTSMIIAQRGFQAGSRIITTSDEVLQELVNLKR
ncbi:flagellar hook protein FlgE [Actinomycetaceae bacterium L2_0104]